MGQCQREKEGKAIHKKVMIWMLISYKVLHHHVQLKVTGRILWIPDVARSFFYINSVGSINNEKRLQESSFRIYIETLLHFGCSLPRLCMKSILTEITKPLGAFVVYHCGIGLCSNFILIQHGIKMDSGDMTCTEFVF